MFAFVMLLFILLLLYYFTVTSMTTSEGFISNVPNVTIPTPITPALNDKVESSTLPGKIPIAPYQQIATMSPLPYQDTQLIKANRQQISTLLDLLKGFLSFEAQELSEKSDPSIQLPLTTARSDFHSLQSEIEVLNRNPGIQPTVTLSHLNEISSNLSYLQQQVRLSGAGGTLQGPINQFSEHFVDVIATGTGTTGTVTTNANVRASLIDLTNFVGRIQTEAQRLSASGTNDPVVVARVGALNRMKGDIQTIVDQVNNGIMNQIEIPIMKNDIDTAFPILGNTSQPLPQIIKYLSLPPYLANLLPSNLQNDPTITREISKLIDKYSDQIVNGVSASFQVKYTSPNEILSKGSGGSTIDTTGFPSTRDLYNATNNEFMPMNDNTPVSDRYAPTPRDAGRGPSHFDWKQRAKEIENQVKQRGLTSSDYGIMSEKNVSSDFSWKGYVRMICTRLQATMDPSLPETCGCPPMDWKGWRIAR